MARLSPLAYRRLAASLSASLLGIAAVLSSPTPSAAAPSGVVQVLSAGSLSNIMLMLEPAFRKDTGYSIQNISEGSSAIASGVVAKTLQGDVFLSASITANRALEGARHGSWINGYTVFGASPTVLAYFPQSRFASALKARPWYDVVSSPGFELGRTNPSTDPGGVLDVDALYGIGYGYNIPSLLILARATRNVYAEDALPGLLQAGQLDAAFMYAVSAHAAKLPFVALAGTRNLSARYTVARFNRAPHPTAAIVFEKWLLSSAGLSIMQKQGLLRVTPPRYVPAAR